MMNGFASPSEPLQSLSAVTRAMDGCDKSVFHMAAEIPYSFTLMRTTLGMRMMMALTGPTYSFLYDAFHVIFMAQKRISDALIRSAVLKSTSW
jgi:hypothetical protein